ncbi:MAG: AmmeMemoRadiSam system radical SAM enzyme [Calditrichota bacterium]
MNENTEIPDFSISRRQFFLKTGRYGVILGGACALASSPSWLRPLLNLTQEVYAAGKLDELAAVAPLARYWVSTAAPSGQCQACHPPQIIALNPLHQHTADIVKCLLCARECTIENGERGRCHVRMNINGELRSLVYGRPIAIHVDPIEKKPFYHFLPGSQALSLATSGCPLQCQFCQNWEISQIRPEDYDVEYTQPSVIVDEAKERSAPVIAFTYNEPTVFVEYLTDIARAARAQNIRSVLISCGFMKAEPLTEMCETLAAIKIDLKGFSPDFYRKVCVAELEPVLRSIKQVARSGVHLEIVNLVVPTLNDSDNMLNDLCDWLIGEVGPDVPVHFTRFHPDYRLLNLPPTPVSTLERSRDIALSKGLHYAYVGNVPDHVGNHTYCPKCGRIIVLRNGFFISELHMIDGCCKYCGEQIAGVWS